MTDFSDMLRPDAVQTGVIAKNKKAVFQHLATIASEILDADPKMIADRLAAREKLGSTGFGGGVAIPHAKLEGLAQVTGVFARLAEPVDFQAVDNLPVDLVFMLLSPTDAGAVHLKALARVSRRLRDKAFLEKLRGGGSPDAVYALFTADEVRDAA
ncbi:PTS sugar transporter subunit IIA [Sphingomonas sp. CFBP 13728]|uniref:PTS sugar transporter subunit IIA n=1 Tax=Sphingomonas sp. CFBP 13728 TaxID=2775294 RepID=UPI00177DC1D4|nr:PTS sugar transporter subunit IIA [Sphingomonas sp. CFBP 13728]MBD8619601.1 PTS sugar transporter subunit IIA [Sphingomonas sp. CFBP 13728]